MIENFSFRKLVNSKARNLKTAWLTSTFFWNPVLVFIIAFLRDGTHHLASRWLESFEISTLVSQVCFGCVLLARTLDHYVARCKGRPEPRRSRSWWFSVSVLVMPLGLFIAFKIIAAADHFIGKPDYLPDLASYKLGLILGTLITAFFFLINTRTEAREAARTAEMKLKTLENVTLHAQIAALTAQINPHLLFNALNTVAALIPTHPEKAEEMIIRLSELYRGILDSSQNMTHSLATEVKICEAYLAVEKARFGERLQSSFQIHSDIDAAAVEIPALSIQPIIENAIKHGFSHRSSGGAVFIQVSKMDSETMKISIEDDGQGFDVALRSVISKGAGTGLKNCKARLELHYGENSSFDIRNRPFGGAIATMTIPYNLLSTFAIAQVKAQ